jgi:GNAT superfamily N-acetyltransferase
MADRPRPDGGDIRKMTSADVDAGAHVLARAFEDDPHFSWIVRDEETRLERLERAFALFIRAIWLPQDHGLIHEQLIGAALWMPPRTWHVPIPTQLRLTPATVRVLRADTPRLLWALTFIERKHPRAPHWYLPIIGVTPAWQGRGYGSALLGATLRRFDRERAPAYLEASTPRNVALYERHGFKVIERCTYARTAPPMWRMWREPSANGADLA